MTLIDHGETHLYEASPLPDQSTTPWSEWLADLEARVGDEVELDLVECYDWHQEGVTVDSAASSINVMGGALELAL